MRNNIIFIGVVKEVPNCGVSMKNKLFIERFRNIYDKVLVVGVKKYPGNVYFLPFQILYLVILAILYPKAKIVVSSNSWEANIIIKILFYLGMAKRVRFWVAGGMFHENVGTVYAAKPFKKVYAIYVQSPKMVKTMEQKGFNNVIYVPNSKYMNYFPDISHYIVSEKTKFVFLSRVHPDKGCGLIIESARNLNHKGFKEKFCVDFYGTIFAEYKEEFNSSLQDLENVQYRGYLDLTKSAGYNILSEYDVMLFPTYWYGEGFPGIVIDAYIAGLPIIASDWNYNTEVVTDETGIIVPHHNQEKLEEEMLRFINHEYDIEQMRMNCQKMVKQYDNRQVLSEENLKRIGML